MEKTSLKEILKQSNGYYLEIYKLAASTTDYVEGSINISCEEYNDILKNQKLHKLQYKRYDLNLASLTRFYYAIKLPINTFIYTSDLFKKNNTFLIRVYDIEFRATDTAPYITKYDREVDVTEIDYDYGTLIVEQHEDQQNKYYMKYMRIENNNLLEKELEKIISNLI